MTPPPGTVPDRGVGACEGIDPADSDAALRDLVDMADHLGRRDPAPVQ